MLFFSSFFPFVILLLTHLFAASFLLKVGTAVVTRSDGRLALGRIGALCEQV